MASQDHGMRYLPQTASITGTEPILQLGWDYAAGTDGKDVGALAAESSE